MASTAILVCQWSGVPIVTISMSSSFEQLSIVGKQAGFALGDPLVGACRVTIVYVADRHDIAIPAGISRDPGSTSAHANRTYSWPVIFRPRVVRERFGSGKPIGDRGSGSGDQGALEERAAGDLHGKFLVLCQHSMLGGICSGRGYESEFGAAPSGLLASSTTPIVELTKHECFVPVSI